QRDVRANIDTEPGVGPFCRTGPARVDDIQLGAVLHALEQMVEENRMGFPGIRSPKQNDVRFFNLAIRTGPAARSENRRQTGDAGGVSSSVTTVDIVSAHDGANELLSDVVQLVDGLGAAEHAEITVIVLRNRPTKRSRDAVERFIPRGRAMG